MSALSTHSLFVSGIKDTFPLVVAAMPFGLVFGAMGQAQGLADWVTLSISIFVFAGASQFIAITMLASGAALPIIVLTVLIVNLRHMLYSISLIPMVHDLSQKWRWPMAFTLTDETFAVVYHKMSMIGAHQHLPFYYLGSSAFMYLNWILCTWLGITLGSQLPTLTSFGLDIAMVVAFIGIVVPHLTLPSHWICALTAAIGGVLTYHWPHQSGLLVSSLLAIIVGVMTENRLASNAHDAPIEQYDNE
ncbi:AzlC family ABC transporter permease [Paraglaciecola aquimarina]|uniref:AzlC family ABC transporter permease n=1 Tax=Paraglaciecola aquimarina TaxID=1235557 RepID=A0ABU3T1T6_9ALTE|nr:AzlC family ABC transporter permease [Paraglaciecola aquimarina]MDU0356168.1 AzlC family ABC transporter permease [Paraglaciecola aquimarina]